MPFPPDAASAGTWTLGDLTVNRIGLGAMRLTGSAAFDLGTPSNRERSLTVLRRAVELGVNHIDTAAFYFSPLRSANELINTALAPYPDDLVITTKVGPGRDPSGNWLGPATPGQLRGQVEENLRQLGRDHLDVVNLRVVAPGPVSEHFGALSQLRDAGMIRHLGISNVRPENLDEALAIAPVVCVQNRYSLDLRRPDTEAWCGPVASTASPSSRSSPLPAREPSPVSRPPTRLGSSRRPGPQRHRGPGPVGLDLAPGPHLLAIPGTGNLTHLEQNVAAGALHLTPEDLAQLTP